MRLPIIRRVLTFRCANQGIILHNITPRAWLSLQTRTRRRDGEGEAFVLSDDLLIGPGEDNTVRQINKSRTTKTNKWLLAKATAPRLVTCMVLLRFALDLVYSVFRRSTIVAGPGLLDFLAADESVPEKLINKLFQILQDLHCDAWVVLKLPGGWTPEKTKLAFCAATRLIGGIWLRLCRAALLPPLCFRYAVDPNASQTQRDGLKRLVDTACEFCLDKGVGHPVKKHLGNDTTPLATLNHPKLRILGDLFQRARVSNTLTENRLGRCTSTPAYRAGGYIKAANLCAKHVVAEHGAQWKAALTKWSNEQPAVVSRVPLACNSSWQYFFKVQREAYPHRNMRQIGEEWDSMTVAKRTVVEQEYLDAKAADNDAPNFAAAEIPNHQTPLGCGSHTWAVRADVLDPFCVTGKVSDVAARWEAAYGHTMQPTAEAAQLEVDTATRPPLCGELFGAGNCRKRIAEDLQQCIEDWKAKLVLLARLAKSSDAVPLYHFVAAGGAATGRQRRRGQRRRRRRDSDDDDDVGSSDQGDDDDDDRRRRGVISSGAYFAQLSVGNCSVRCS